MQSDSHQQLTCIFAWPCNDYKNPVLTIRSDFMGKSKKSVNYKTKQTRAGNASINIV